MVFILIYIFACLRSLTPPSDSFTIHHRYRGGGGGVEALVYPRPRVHMFYKFNIFRPSLDHASFDRIVRQLGRQDSIAQFAQSRSRLVTRPYCVVPLWW